MTTKRLTLATVRTELRTVGVVITRTDSEYRVNFRNGREATAYYTPDLDDARNTGIIMARSPASNPQEHRPMTTTYDPMIHSHITCPGSEGPMAIILHVGTRVWVAASHVDDDMIPGAVQVGDGLTSGYSTEGDCIISIPASACRFYTEQEASDLVEIAAIDQAMLSNAR